MDVELDFMSNVIIRHAPVDNTATFMCYISLNLLVSLNIGHIRVCILEQQSLN
jgi:hypothetical protein